MPCDWSGISQTEGVGAGGRLIHTYIQCYRKYLSPQENAKTISHRRPGRRTERESKRDVLNLLIRGHACAVDQNGYSLKSISPMNSWWTGTACLQTQNGTETVAPQYTPTKSRQKHAPSGFDGGHILVPGASRSALFTSLLQEPLGLCKWRVSELGACRGHGVGRRVCVLYTAWVYPRSVMIRFGGEAQR